MGETKITRQCKTHPGSRSHTIDSSHNRLGHLFQCFHHRVITRAKECSIIGIICHTLQVLPCTERFSRPSHDNTTYVTRSCHISKSLCQFSGPCFSECLVSIWPVWCTQQYLVSL